MKVIFSSLATISLAWTVSAGVLCIPPVTPPAAVVLDSAAFRNEWVSPGMAAAIEDAFTSAYRRADDGRLMRGTLDVDPAESLDPSFGKSRWPQIVRAVQWARKLANTRMPEQAKTLMPRLKDIFAKEGVPPELAWIAEVESTFDPRALSATGARGLFQFTPATAERFGLLTRDTDNRNVPEKSARAAAQYLAFLYSRFGDWHLALAGYNAGEGCVARLLERYHATTFHEIAAHLPEETQIYVPKVAMTLAVREKIRLSALPSPSPNPTWN
jgi:hypothetical protein